MALHLPSLGAVILLLGGSPLTFAGQRDSLEKKLQSTVKAFVGQAKITGLQCAHDDGDGAFARGPASEVPKIILTYRRKGDPNFYQIETQLENNMISQVRSMTVFKSGNTQWPVENQTWKTFSLQPRKFRVDAEGQDDVYEMKIGNVRSLEVRNVERIAPLMAQCCRKKACQQNLLAPVKIKKSL